MEGLEFLINELLPNRLGLVTLLEFELAHVESYEALQHSLIAPSSARL